jgi:hypothetical protein
MTIEQPNAFTGWDYRHKYQFYSSHGMHKGVNVSIMLLLALFIIFAGPVTNSFIHAKKLVSEKLAPCTSNEAEGNCLQLAPSNQSNQTLTTSRQAPGSDETRPSGSMEAEHPDDIQVGGLGGKHVPNLETVDDFKVNVRITLDKIHFLSIHEDNHDWNAQPNFPGHGTDTTPDGGEFVLVMYVQGLKHEILYRASQIYTQYPKTLSTSVDLKMPKNIPLMLFTVGYEIDACPLYNFPSDVTKGISSTTPVDYLIQLQTNLMKNINTQCGPTDEKNDPIGYITKIYSPPTYGAGSHTEYSTGIPNAPDFELTYHIDVSSPTTQEVQK